MNAEATVAVVIPCFRVGQRALDVIARIGPEVGWIFAIDDACPEHSGDLIERDCHDPRVRVLRHTENGGVGAATLTGLRAAVATPARVIVKLDGDGQMDPALIPRLAAPILRGQADYAKGNRFHRFRDVAAMPTLRLAGNAALSFLTKLSTGYWQLFDPTNGFVAIERRVAAALPHERIARRYFFESDLLYELGQLRAKIVEMPMQAVYGDEPSSLRPLAMIGPFLRGHLRNLARRLVYSYFVRGFSPASVELLLGPLLLLFGLGFGSHAWWASITTGAPATAGTVMLAALPILLGLQLLLSWLNFDVAAEPREPVAERLGDEAG
ncbi:MAG: glycosyltransferase family 2 protein [Xanthomonadales bacterium]|nr:glycosyltransferase family 2 protein [Xanthomonadales bacterium]